MKGQNKRAPLNQALELFHFAFRAFTTGPDTLLAEQGLQRVHHRILYFVGRYPQLSINELLRILGVSKQALNGPLRTVIASGLIAVHPDPRDRRIKRLQLSTEGIAMEERLSGKQRLLMSQVFEQLGPEAEQHWRQIMHSIAMTQFAHLAEDTDTLRRSDTAEDQ
ncbi:MarR family winged helix-turn-helix transcriptional regulator [Pseudaeromonas sharmana]|uniref:MarR family winged helix-turn-helix transcriptional regulator n=1 Tax=Pseudaeromonas sharmana TaxID=328412 RepID=A0ABV8CJH5_9GAMM